MEIADELASVRRRLEQIANGPFLPGVEFDAIVTAFSPSRSRDESTMGTMTRPGIERLVDESATAWRVDPALVEAIIANESGFDPKATSGAGARGLMQLMPETAARLGVADAYDPKENVEGGTRYLREMLDRFGSLELAVAAYNAGPAAVERYGGVPPYAETRTYVRNVLTKYRAYGAANSTEVRNSETRR
jgi:soluble lytic murein transglycosylase-like protein